MLMLALPNAFHAYGHVWIYDLTGTYAMMHIGTAGAFGPGVGDSKEESGKCAHTVMY